MNNNFFKFLENLPEYDYGKMSISKRKIDMSKFNKLKRKSKQNRSIYAY